ncbi:MAG: hypothetical protein RL385_3713 [Pseudomonadota bacterium]|jgi:hypothetical protein
MGRLHNQLGKVAWLALASACSAGGSPALPLSAEGLGTNGPGGNSVQAAPDAGVRMVDVAGDAMVEAPPPYKLSSRSLVQWKRHAAFEADLMAALALTREQLCVEVGGKNCIRDVHLVPLGGNEPYESGLMKPSPEPLATTSSAVDRILLSACSTRARMDSATKPEVFAALDFRAALPARNDPAIAATIRDLYRRFLARDPAPSEAELVSALADAEGGESLSTQDFATLACFTIASTTEFLFF